MKPVLASCLTLAAAVTIQLSSVGSARADDTVVIAGSSPSPAEATSSGPNRYLLHSGLFTLGVSYVPALVVAIESDVGADDNLYAPVVGPWLDLAKRDDCQGDCSGETVNKVLLVTDGIFQGIGALQILGAFIFPETRSISVTARDGSTLASFSVMPAKLGHGSGLLAVGNF